MRSPEPESRPQEQPLDEATVRFIMKMIDGRRQLLDDRWRTLERGSQDSGENLAVSSALADLKWAILDEWDSSQLRA